MRLALILCALIPCAAFAAEPTVSKLEYTGYAAVGADMLTTHIAVHNLDMDEGNPLLGNHPGDGLILFSGIARSALIFSIVHSDAPTRTKKIALTILDSVQLGVVGNNISIITHRNVPAAPAVGIGIAIPLTLDFWRR
jgi:hypothetical protein